MVVVETKIASEWAKRGMCVLVEALYVYRFVQHSRSQVHISFDTGKLKTIGYNRYCRTVSVCNQIVASVYGCSASLSSAGSSVSGGISAVIPILHPDASPGTAPPNRSLRGAALAQQQAAPERTVPSQAGFWAFAPSAHPQHPPHLGCILA
jgi:hypothetical protein